MKRVLIIKLASLGDVLATTHVFEGIKSLQNIQVDHLVMEHCREATLNNPFVNQQFLIPSINKSWKFLLSFKFYFLFFRLIITRYDDVFLFHRSTILQLLVILIMSKKRYGYKGPLSFFFTRSLHYNNDVNRSLQEWKLICLSEHSYSTPSNLSYFLPRNAKLKSIEKPLPENFITVNPGGGNLHASAETRCWPISNYANFLNKLGRPVVIVGRGQDDEIKANNLINNLNVVAVNLTSQLSLDQTALIMKKGRGYVGNDSGLAFLAAAIKVPSLILYGPTSPSSAKPLGLKGKVLQGNTWCSPCYSPFDGKNGQMYKCKDNICMQSIIVEIAINNFKEVLKL